MAVNSKQFNENGTQFYPETHVEAVVDGNGNNLGGILLNNFRLMAYAFDQVDSETTTTNPEWASVITDNEGKILAGMRIDGSVFFAEL